MTHNSLKSNLLAFLLAAIPLAARAQTNTILIGTAHSSLTLFVGHDGRLYQLGYGRSTAEAATPAKDPARETEFHPQFGDGFVLEPALQATHGDGNTSTDLAYVRHTATTLDDDTTLTRIELKDKFYPFFVTLCLKACRNEDVIEQWTEIRHDEEGRVTLWRFASSAPMFRAREYWLTHLHGDWADEAQMVEERLTSGLKILDSKLGVRASKYHTPSFILSLDKPADEESGETFGGSLEWSGSFQLAFEVDWENRLRALAGINPFDSQYRLERGKVFTTPAMLWTWSDHGKGQVSRNFHHWAMRHGVRDAAQPRPVLLNNWEATQFDFNESKLVSLLDGAKDLGVELFLLDDGWFGNKYPRNDDHAGLGDWQVNTNKLPRGLSFLAGEARQRALRFGIWLEPEMVNPRSALYEKHPEWAIGQPHRKPETSRNQLDLDLTRPAVRDFAWKVIDGTLGPNPGITYLKWDANRYITQPGSTWLKPEEQSHLWVDDTLALYQIMAKLEENFPNVTAMLCSGGGGRADYGALKYFHCFWPSDNTDPARRVFIQWGFSHFFPACALCNHVTRMGKRPVKFALDVAMSGDLGFDVDLAKTSPEDRAAMSAAIKLYKDELRSIVQGGDLYRLESPYDGMRACLDYVAPDQSKAVLFVYQLNDSEARPVKLRGLNPAKLYTVREVNLPGGVTSAMSENGETATGAALMNDGLKPSCHQAYESVVIELTPAAAK
jgi:alpha-galactosidase